MSYARIADQMKQAAAELPGSIGRRTLGATGLSVTQLGLGGESLLSMEDKEDKSIAMVRKALELGINYYDTAHIYSPSERRLGEALYGVRNQIVLASKTDKRDRDGARRDLDNSLKDLRTDHLDIWQIHHIDHKEEVEKVFKEDGAMKAVGEALDENLIRYVGVTGHYDPDPMLEMLKRYDFDTVMMPINAADVHRNSFIKKVLPVAVKKGLGIIGMKICSRGRLFTPKEIYSMRQALSYSLSQPISVAIVGISTMAQLYENAAIAKSFERLSEKQQEELEKKTKSYEGVANFFKKGNEEHNPFWSAYKPEKKSGK